MEGCKQEQGQADAGGDGGSTARRVEAQAPAASPLGVLAAWRLEISSRAGQLRRPRAPSRRRHCGRLRAAGCCSLLPESASKLHCAAERAGRHG